MHGLPQGLHGLWVGLAQEGHAVDVDQLVVGPQPAVARRGASVDHALDEDAEVDGGLPAGLAGGRLAFDADTEAGSLRVVDGDVKGQHLEE